MSNLYEAISDYLMNSMYNENGIASRGALAAIVTEYDALAPDWSQAPDDARWYTIDVEGDCAWHDEEPMLHGGRWYSPHKYTVNGIDLPIGIDWQLCKWQRPEVTA